MSEVHSKGFSHNDLKSNNIILGENNEISIIDLGNACEFGTVFGYKGNYCFWLGPEMFTDHPLTVKSDIFSVGIILADLYNKIRIGHGFTALLDSILA